MKNLIYIFSFIFLCACVDKHDIQDLKGDIQNDLTIIKNGLHQEIEQEFDKYIEIIKKELRQSKSKIMKRYLNTVGRLKRKYKKVYNFFEKNHTNQIYKDVYKNNVQWLNKIAEEYELELPLFLDITELNQFLTKLDTENMKEVLQLDNQVSFEKVMYKLGMFRLQTNHGWYKMMLFGINDAKQIEEGKEVELNQVFLQGNNIFKQKYDYDTTLINQGKIKQEYGIFHISIPTQKTGEQGFEVVLKLKEWETDKDTTLYFTKTFEVIK